VTAVSDTLRALAARLAERRPNILGAWHRLVDDDPGLTTASSITRVQFYDHIPDVLDAFEQRLRAQSTSAKTEATAEQKQSAEQHGLHRWQQGFRQLETMREWAHLHLCLLDELELFAVDHPDGEPTAMRAARRELARLCGDGVCESAARYARLQQAEAASRVRDLEQALAQLQAGDRERAQRWREAAHDLRSTVAIVTTAAAVLDRDDTPEDARLSMSHALQRGTISLRELLADLMDLARLEAGQERRNLATFDAAAMLREFCEPLRAVAAQRNLFFRIDGAEHLLVEGDAIKVQRIAQNLITNAIRATEHGGIRLTWEARTDADRAQWIMCVQDTGSGLDPSTAAPLERALKRATDESNAIEQHSAETGEAALEPAPTLPSRSPHDSAGDMGGEGIGLSIVKRLCELLDASLELETSAGQGTTFRVIFPRDYQPVADKPR
jgi:signal transduction histidine kinase